MPSLKIVHKTIIIALSVIIGFIAMGAMNHYTANKMRTLGNIQLETSQAESGMLTLRRNEKDFLARKDPKYIKKFSENYQSLQDKVTQLSEAMAANGMDNADAQNLASVLSAYNKRFQSIATIQEKIGLDHKSGLHGTLRKAVHEAETLVKEADDDRLMKDILMLRRREKDFMQRLDIKYLGKFDKDLAVFQQDLAQSDLSSGRQQAISQAMSRYQIDFHALVAEYEVKGFSSKEGMLGEMRKTIHQSEEMLSSLLEHSTKAIDNAADQANIFAALFSLIVGLTILSGMAVIGMGISRNLRHLHDTMMKASTDQNLSIRARLRGNDEIADMGRSFNTMMEGFAKLLGEMQVSSEQLSAAAEELNMITQNTTDGIMRQNTETDQVATAMNEMNMTVQAVAKNAGDAAVASQQAQDVAIAGKDVVGKNMSGIQGLANEINSTAELMSELNQESENIGTVLNVIRGIAEQTNLLALNAAIEAARAGEQGRGFAVVADEVRALAQRSQQSTMEIEEIVERLQSRANTAVNAMNHGQDQATNSVDQAEEAGASLDTILTSITAINDMNLQIASAAEEQSAAAEEINRNVVNISQIAQESSNSADQTTQTSRLLAELSTQLQEMVSRFRVN